MQTRADQTSVGGSGSSAGDTIRAVDVVGSRNAYVRGQACSCRAPLLQFRSETQSASAGAGRRGVIYDEPFAGQDLVGKYPLLSAG